MQMPTPSTINLWLGTGLVAFAGVISLIAAFILTRRSTKKIAGAAQAIDTLTKSNQHLHQALRQCTAASLHHQAILLTMHPVIPGNTKDTLTLEGRMRCQTIELILADLPRDVKSQGIRIAEFTHRLCDTLFQAYGKNSNNTYILIDVQPIILEAACATHVGLILQELIANALQYGIDPGAKQKISVLVKERDNKLILSVTDNGIGLKAPYEPQFSFGLQLVDRLAKEYHGQVIINSRPGTRVDVYLSQYQKAQREVFITPTQRIH
jgi:two-component sensor histidine kinase